jgi:hypothetical protein
MLVCDVNVGDRISCLYPRNGNRNVLANREGFVEAKGTGPSGEYVKVQLTDGTYRTFSTKRIVDLEKVAS